MMIPERRGVARCVAPQSGPQFYSSDGLHPSALGSYAMALSLFGILYDRSVVGLPSSIRLPTASDFSVDAATARLIQESADEANRQFGSKGTPLTASGLSRR